MDSFYGDNQTYHTSDATTELPDKWTDQSVRCAVQELLKEVNQSTLAKLSPLSQSAISNIANWKYQNKLSVEKCVEFGQWYKHYKREQMKHDNFDEGVKDTRLTFHPELEIPQLRQWYKKSKTPNDNKLMAYANSLNSSHVRQEKPQITVAKLKNWWKNERQREKRLSMRVGGIAEEDSVKTKAAKCDDSSYVDNRARNPSDSTNTRGGFQKQKSNVPEENVITLYNVDDRNISKVPVHTSEHLNQTSSSIKYGGNSLMSFTGADYQQDFVLPGQSKDMLADKSNGASNGKSNLTFSDHTHIVNPPYQLHPSYNSSSSQLQTTGNQHTALENVNYHTVTGSLFFQQQGMSYPGSSQIPSETKNQEMLMSSAAPPLPHPNSNLS